jgi:hypothetical protein
MWRLCKDRGIRLRAQQIEPAIKLKPVSADNRRAGFAGGVGRKFGFSGCSWTDDKERARHPIRRSSALIFPRGLDDLSEAARVKTCSADEGAVDIGLAHEFAGVLGFHAAAVLNPDSLGCGLVTYFAQDAADERVRLLRLLGRCIAPGPDS